MSNTKSERHRLTTTTAAAFAGVLLLISAGASALEIKWSFTTGSSSPIDGTPGNTRTFLGDDGATSVTASAWAAPFAGDFEKSFLGRFGSGLGSTHSGDDNGDDGQHTVDNVKGDGNDAIDFVVFEFSAPVIASSVRLRAFEVDDEGPDSDFQAWVGNLSDMGLTSVDQLMSMNVAVLSSLTRLDENTTGSGGTRTATLELGSNPNPESGRLLIIRAGVDSMDATGTNNANSREDGFKIKKLWGETVYNVPEPASVMLLGLSLAALGLGIRRRRN